MAKTKINTMNCGEVVKIGAAPADPNFGNLKILNFLVSTKVHLGTFTIQQNPPTQHYGRRKQAKTRKTTKNANNQDKVYNLDLQLLLSQVQ